MNILPLVISFMIIFSCLCFTFIKEAKSLNLIEMTFEGYNHSEKAIKNAVIKKTFEKIKVDSPRIDKGIKLEKPQEELKKKQATTSSKRKQYPPSEYSKFCLRALSRPEMKLSQHPLYEPLAELLRLLYKKNVFSKLKEEGIEYRLIEALVAKSQKFPSAKELCYLYPDDPQLQQLYYKLLKGTNQYTAELGIPPLSHYLSLEASDKVVTFSAASPPVLTALLGNALTQEILKKEEEKSITTQKISGLSKEEFESLILKDPLHSASLTPLQPYFNYSKKVSKKQIIAKRDKKTGITLEKELKP